MTADEIRKAQQAAFKTVQERALTGDPSPITFDQKLICAQTDVLFEIAAQLAELNQALRPASSQRTGLCELCGADAKGPFNRYCDYHHKVLIDVP